MKNITIPEVLKSYDDIRNFLLETRHELIKFIKDNEFTQISEYQAINRGHCYFFVRLAMEINPTLKIVQNECHCYIKHGDKLIDATGMYDYSQVSKLTISPIASDFSHHQFQEVPLHGFIDYWEHYGKYKNTFKQFNDAILQGYYATAKVLKDTLHADLQKEKDAVKDLQYYNTSDHYDNINNNQYRAEAYLDDNPEAYKKSYKYLRGKSAWEL